ncbi:MAG TPA: DUF4124 domain-containing protein [Burkholderiales bacterium]|nr:DUF4124 domain-containing protein [Burkholderiales bacterium]
MLKASMALVFGALTALSAHAQVTEIFKCKGTDGHWTYTNDRREAERQKCEVVTRQVNVAPAQKAPPRSAGANGFPRESANDRASAATRQREILEKELATEQASLAKARQDLAAQEAVRMGDERNYARVEERLQPFKDSVETHEKNIEALRRELNNLSR